MTILNVIGFVGAGIGTFSGGYLAPKIGGIRRTLTLFNFLGLLSCLLKFIENFPAILLGRILFSICAGLQTFCMSKALNDTIPAEYMSTYGSFVNSGICMGYFLS